MGEPVTLLGIVAAFLACQGTLIGGFIHVVKRILARSDNTLEERDKQVLAFIAICKDQATLLREALDEMRAAVASFASFEREESGVHDKILDRLDSQEKLLVEISATLERTAELQRLMLEKLEVKTP